MGLYRHSFLKSRHVTGINVGSTPISLTILEKKERNEKVVGIAVRISITAK